MLSAMELHESMPATSELVTIFSTDVPNTLRGVFEKIDESLSLFKDDSSDYIRVGEGENTKIYNFRIPESIRTRNKLAFPPPGHNFHSPGGDFFSILIQIQ